MKISTLIFIKHKQNRSFFSVKLGMSHYRFKNVLKDGKSYYITCPSFAALKPNTFRLIPQDQKLTFVQETVDKECTQFSGPKFGFSIVDFQSVLSLVHPQNLSVGIFI
uniref:Uncharacterized protein n=1 Tax=Lactuca sativa TaxID=4236 RepID=A0A9R1VXH1_LACSA|nr:hypothetical protein LSAT_V11C400209500 [Lactuca sativa]